MTANTITLNQAQELQTAYGLVDDYLLGGVLPRNVRLGVAHIPRSSDGGVFLSNKWDDKGNGACHEILIDEHLLTLDKSRWVAALVHQMVHLLQYEHDSLPSNGRHYHNKEFAAIMRNVGLPLISLDPDRKEGSEVGQKVDYSIDSEGRFQKMIQILGDKLIISTQPRNAGTQLDVSAKMSRSAKYRHYCPKCDSGFKTDTKEVNLLCGKCGRKIQTETMSD